MIRVLIMSSKAQGSCQVLGSLGKSCLPCVKLGVELAWLFKHRPPLRKSRAALQARRTVTPVKRRASETETRRRSCFCLLHSYELWNSQIPPCRSKGSKNVVVTLQAKKYPGRNEVSIQRTPLRHRFRAELLTLGLQQCLRFVLMSGLKSRRSGVKTPQW